MAISVDKVYKTVLSILNKESRGFLTPDEFERIGNQVQLDILEKNFHDYNRAVIKHYRGAGVNDYGNIPEKIEQKIDPFFKQADITLTNGIGTLPTDLFKTINISITNKTIQLEKVDKKSLSYLLSSTNLSIERIGLQSPLCSLSSPLKIKIPVCILPTG